MEANQKHPRRWGTHSLQRGLRYLRTTSQMSSYNYSRTLREALTGFTAPVPHKAGKWLGVL